MRASKIRVQKGAIMKEVYFYVFFAAITTLQYILILNGFLPPLLAYSIGNILFSLAIAVILIYMGWSFAKLGLKKVAIKGVIAAVVSMVVISLATVIGHIIKEPVLGIYIPSIYYLPIYLLLLALLGIVLCVLFATMGVWLAQRAKHSKKTRKTSGNR
jgi:MFS family permease